MTHEEMDNFRLHLNILATSSLHYNIRAYVRLTRSPANPRKREVAKESYILERVETSTKLVWTVRCVLNRAPPVK